MSAWRHIGMDDRGPAKYFHGRKREWQFVEARLQEAAAARRGGTIALVQGAPGSGKSALLHEYGTRAAKLNWRVLYDLDCEALYNPAALAHAAGERYSYGETHPKQVGLGADSPFYCKRPVVCTSLFLGHDLGDW